MEATVAEDKLRRVVVDVGRAEIEFRVAQGDGPAFFSLGMRKSGSTLVHKIVAALARANGLNIVDVPDRFFQAGLRLVDWENIDLSEVVRPDNVYIGYRAFPQAHGDMDIFRDSKKVFMFRDPRDALVSLYFSDAYSHLMPRSGGGNAKSREETLKNRANALATDIDSYVLSQTSYMKRALTKFAVLLDDPNCLTLRYEDYIFQKKRLIHKVAKHYGWTATPAQVTALLDTIEQVPNSEDKKRFVRKAVPGDHRAKLKPETIATLDAELQDVMETYDYY